MEEVCSLGLACSGSFGDERLSRRTPRISISSPRALVRRPQRSIRRPTSPQIAERAVVTHIGDACRAAGFFPIAMALKCTKLDRSGRAKSADFCHRLLEAWGSGSGSRRTRCLHNCALFIAIRA